VFFVEEAIWRYQYVELTTEFAAGRIIDTMGDALLVLDDAGTIRVVNRALCGLFRGDEQEFGRTGWRRSCVRGKSNGMKSSTSTCRGRC
jgi:PAS domain-containing protein